MNLREFCSKHSLRNSCRCGSCPPVTHDQILTEPFVDLVFFDVTLAGQISAEEFSQALKGYEGPERYDPFDGEEHTYHELGTWLNDQELALRLMGMGALLKVWELFTPFTEFGRDLPKEVALQMAQAGLLAIQVRKVVTQVSLQLGYLSAMNEGALLIVNVRDRYLSRDGKRTYLMPLEVELILSTNLVEVINEEGSEKRYRITEAGRARVNG